MNAVDGSTPPRLEPMMRLVVELRPLHIGRTPAGQRREVTFSGTATSPHWDGEWPAGGVDHIVVTSDGTSRLDVHAVVGEGDEVVAYRGTGRAGGGSSSNASSSRRHRRDWRG